MDAIRVCEILALHTLLLNTNLFQCIAFGAEEYAEEYEYNISTTFYQYYSSKYSPVQGEAPVELPESLEPNRDMYREMILNNDTHFYNLPVNTSYSSVHVPTNVYDRRKYMHTHKRLNLT